MQKYDRSKLKTLFLSMLYISGGTFGGGFVIVSFMQRRFVDELAWFTQEEMLNFVAVGQACPGPIAVNTAILVGYKVGGVLGAALAVLGTMLPPLCIITAVSFFYTAFIENTVVAAFLQAMQAAVAAVIIDVVISTTLGILKRKQTVPTLILACAFAAVYFLKANLVLVIAVAGATGIVQELVRRKNGGKVRDEK
ncbi:chromate transporter [Ruminococcaceae bacterium OttesenSCG-928-N02]|nr:chromate transporter [Ruminococcaceae bacterium OttesenSCG-928-N02]